MRKIISLFHDNAMWFFISLVLTLPWVESQGQTDEKFKYRRSSLHRILIDTKTFPNKEKVLESYYEAPFPDKYNDHTIEAREISFIGTEDEGNSDALSTLAGGFSKSLEDVFVIQDELDEKGVGRELVAKWFNRQPDGTFDMSLIAERGYYNASEMEASIAAKTVRGNASLADAGLELIRNTFVVVSQMDFIENAAVLDAVASAGDDEFQESFNAVLDAFAPKAKEGYYVSTSSYLFQLDWTESVEATFYEEYWVDESNIETEPEKVEAFNETDLFTLRFVGRQNQRTLVTGLKGSDLESGGDFINLATVRNLDKMYAKLQKNYNVFKTKTPIISLDPLAAKIGKKEGLEGGEKFEVLEQTVDKETGLTKYVNRGTIKVNGDKIWDNRYSVTVGGTNIEGVPKGREFTEFSAKNTKKFYPGMLIRQVK